jgi:hypothetical protein
LSRTRSALSMAGNGIRTVLIGVFGVRVVVMDLIVNI